MDATRLSAKADEPNNQQPAKYIQFKTTLGNWRAPMYVIDKRTGKRRYANEYEQSAKERWIWWAYAAIGVIAGIHGWNGWI